jgi:hypothetical protein
MLFMNWLEMPSRQSSVCTIPHVIVANVTSVKQADLKYAWRSTNMCPQGLIEKSKLAPHAYEEGHKICWKEVKVLQI